MTTTLLEHCTCDNTPIFSLDGRTVPTKVVSVYDGDTVTLALALSPGQLFTFKARLSGIDTPEIRPRRIQPNRDAEKKAAKYCRNRLLQIVTDQTIDLYTDYSKKELKTILNNNKKIIWARCGTFGKFGRPLIKLFLNEEDLCDKTKSVNKLLIREGLAYRYHGGKKEADFTTYFSAF